MSIVARSLLMVNVLPYQKIKTKREKAFYQEVDEAAHHGIH